MVFEAWRQQGFAGLETTDFARRQKIDLLRFSRALTGFPLLGSRAEQFFDRRRRRHVVVQDGIDRLRDRHVDAQFVARRATSRAVLTPSATWPSSARICGSVLPAASASPTRRLRDRSPVQVRIRSPMPARPMKVSRCAAERLAEAGDFGQSARHQRGAGVEAEPQSIADAGGNGHDVLDRATDFDTGQVVVGVDAQRGAVQSQRRVSRAKSWHRWRPA